MSACTDSFLGTNQMYELEIKVDRFRMMPRSRVCGNGPRTHVHVQALLS